MGAHKTVRVLVVDDSAVVRNILSRELRKDPQIEVVGTAQDPYVARDKIVELQPDVLTLDVEMPRMDGITFLKKLMASYPMPVVVVSSLTPQGGLMAIEALEAGAVEVMCKPGPSYTVAEMGPELAAKVKLAARIGARPPLPTPELRPTRLRSRRAGSAAEASGIVAIGASTGGVDALQRILTALPADAPGIVIAQHMPQYFSKAFADRVNRLCDVQVKEAEDGDPVGPGRVLVAPGNRHMLVERGPGGYRIQIKEGPRITGHRPSVNVLFRSVAEAAGAHAVGVILTGMGNDGARGLALMKQAGATTIAQDEASCVVFGMPREAIATGAVDHVVPLDRIAEKILEAAERRQTAA
ncbi:MAG: chemotaxis response regulator protein-glutamate methylesterase [Deferrisomatales bacterium]